MCPTRTQQEEKGRRIEKSKRKPSSTNSISTMEAVLKGGSRDAVEKLYGKGKMCLAPMVRAGTLPLRLLSLYYGADTVYSEEIIDFKLQKNCEFRMNEKLGLNELINWKNGKPVVVYQTCPFEEGKNVFQLGSSNSSRALKAAELVAPHVAGIDINMGCPKHFSIQAGMGAALLQTPEIAVDIIKTLRRNLDIPVTCKIRLLETPEKTIEYAKLMEQAGAQAIGVHMRERDMRPREPALWDSLKPVVDALSIPVIANGDIYSVEDAKTIQEKSGCSSSMFARGALYNPAVFGKYGNIDVVEQCKNYLRVAAVTDNHFANTKYTALRILHRDPSRTDLQITALKTPEEMYGEFGLEEFWAKRETYRPLKDGLDYLFDSPLSVSDAKSQRTDDQLEDERNRKKVKTSAE